MTRVLVLVEALVESSDSERIVIQNSVNRWSGDE